MPVKHKGFGILAAAWHTCLAFSSMLNKKTKRQQCIFPREQVSSEGKAIGTQEEDRAQAPPCTAMSEHCCHLESMVP